MYNVLANLINEFCDNVHGKAVHAMSDGFGGGETGFGPGQHARTQSWIILKMHFIHPYTHCWIFKMENRILRQFAGIVKYDIVERQSIVPVDIRFSSNQFWTPASDS